MIKTLLATAALTGLVIAAPAIAQQQTPKKSEQKQVKKPQQVAANQVKPTAQKAAPAQAARPQGQAQLPPPEAMIILIRSSVVALSQANLTNNYSVLSSLGSPGFRAVNTPQKLAQTFEGFRANRIDMNPVVFLTPQLTTQPAMQNGRMRLVGFFPSQPMRVNFDMTFEPDQGVWKLYGLGVNLQSDQPAVARPAPGRAPLPGNR
jgi:hypothetical protein